MNYYNDNNPWKANELRRLIATQQIPQGIVDERSITEVQPSDLAGFTQCHFFAGIGGRPLALQYAGWPQDKEVWTASCPCQPYSDAGSKQGDAMDNLIHAEAVIAWQEKEIERLNKLLVNEPCPDCGVAYGMHFASCNNKEKP